jgi:hypothetical protein
MGSTFFSLFPVSLDLSFPLQIEGTLCIKCQIDLIPAIIQNRFLYDCDDRSLGEGLPGLAHAQFKLKLHLFQFNSSYPKTIEGPSLDCEVDMPST